MSRNLKEMKVQAMWILKERDFQVKKTENVKPRDRLVIGEL